jgi:hypothetical protein
MQQHPCVKVLTSQLGLVLLTETTCRCLFVSPQYPTTTSIQINNQVFSTSLPGLTGTLAGTLSSAMDHHSI